MSKKLIMTLVILGIILIPLFVLIGAGVSSANRDVALHNQFKQESSNRQAQFDKMWKIISQKSQVATTNKNAFQSNVEAIMSGRKDAEGLMMKWVQESNPNANFSEVSKLYADLMRTIESERDEFFETERRLASIVNEDDNLLDQFPGSIWLSILGRKHIDYKPISSDKTEEVFKTGKDNGTKLDL